MSDVPPYLRSFTCDALPAFTSWGQFPSSRRRLKLLCWVIILLLELLRHSKIVLGYQLPRMQVALRHPLYFLHLLLVGSRKIIDWVRRVHALYIWISLPFWESPVMLLVNYLHCFLAIFTDTTRKDPHLALILTAVVLWATRVLRLSVSVAGWFRLASFVPSAVAVRIAGHLACLEQVRLLCLAFRVTDIGWVTFASLLLEVGDLLLEEVVAAGRHQIANNK